MITLEHVTKKYGEVVAVDDFSIDITNREVCVLVGPSGCGKTTLLRMINRLIEPTSGRILINGEDTRTIKPERLRQSVGYAIQSVGLFPHMTVAANIAVVPELLRWTKQRIKQRVSEMLTLVGLNTDECAVKYPSQLSGGEAQRVGVARALAADPPILLMDEPFGAVDPLTRERLQAQFLHIQQQLMRTVILVTHDLDEAIRLADRIAIMNAGKLVQYDTPETILSKPANKFVHDFIGTDRALKRLSRISVEGFIKTTPVVRLSDTIEKVKTILGHQLSAWVVNEAGQPLGWVDREQISEASSVKEAMVLFNMHEASVHINATLREALSRMLGQGFRYIPVVNGKGRLVGEVSLHDIEAATAEKEA